MRFLFMVAAAAALDDHLRTRCRIDFSLAELVRRFVAFYLVVLDHEHGRCHHRRRRRRPCCRLEETVWVGTFTTRPRVWLSAPIVLPAFATSAPLSSWRCFGFCTLGTCVGNVMQTPVHSILRSSRCSVGVGISTTNVPMLPRVELTYAWPIRYGPHDARRNFQWGIGIDFD